MINNENKLGHDSLEALNEFYNVQTPNESESGSIIPIYTVRGSGDKRVIITHDWMGDIEGNWKHAVDYFDDGKGHIIKQNQPLAICDKTARDLSCLGRDDIFISPSTWFYDGGGCC
jgi:hypothetical protein